MSQSFANPLPGVPSVESPFFETLLETHDPPLSAEWKRVAIDLNRDGFAVFDFPDPDFEQRAEAIKADMLNRFNWRHWFAQGYERGEGMRVQDAWTENAHVKALAANATVLQLLSTLYGRRAWPFQTLNFPVGTQQHYHTDAVHFSSVPERFMCGVWIALEDVDADSGPLQYFAGSHKWPIYVNEHIGVQGEHAQTIFEPMWERMVAQSGLQPQLFMPKKGQALIWAANLLHGGSKQNDPHKTRWSQVTHYYFDDCAYYTPLSSDPFAGRIFFREPTDISTGRRMRNSYNGAAVPKAFIDQVLPAGEEAPPAFDAASYLAANPDVAAAGVDPTMHYMKFGRFENRRLRP